MANEEHVLKTNKKKSKSKKLSINEVISNSFSNLINKNKNVRINNGAVLVNHLINNHSDEKTPHNVKHSIKRLVRGVGSTTLTSKAGFFAPFVAYLKTISNEELNISEIFNLAKKELITGGSKQDKIDSHAYIGRILVCGALIKSEKLVKATNEEISEAITMLISASKQRQFHSSLAYTFLVELQSKLNTKKFKNIMWPIIKEELNKPWNKQTIDTVYFIFVAQQTHPSVINIQELMGSPELICSETYSSLGIILFDVKDLLNINHPFYEIFCSEIDKSTNFVDFWSSEIEKRLEKTPTEAVKILSLNILKKVFNKTQQKIKTATLVLSNNFITMIISSFSNSDKKNIGFLKDFFKDFFESIVNFAKNTSDQGSKLNLINKFIITPGNLLFDSITSSNVVSSIISTMNIEDVKQLTEFYKKVVFNKIVKSKKDSKISWTDAERIHAIKMIQKLTQHNSMLNDIEWRTDQMVFLLNLSLFHTDDGVTLTTKANEMQLKNVKTYFFQSLETKFPKLENEKEVLLKLVEHANNTISTNKGNKFLQNPLDNASKNAWKIVYLEVSSKEKTSKLELKLIFDILLMHMGLHLFNEPKIALDAIEELNSCIKRVTMKSSEKKTTNNTAKEPEWIEVIIDLFLHLLSQNSSPVRNVITKVFPGLCSNMTLSAIHQILSVLNMNEENNPLTYMNENDESEDDEDESDDEADSDNETDSDNENKSNAESEDDEDDSDADEKLDAASEQLKNAITQALGANAMNSGDDTDIDVNDLEFDQGNKIDKALSLAFKLHSQNRKTNKNNKKDRIAITIVGHFRMRVLDLLEVYLQHNPKISFTFEIMLALFDMLYYCIKDKNTLITKVKSLLDKSLTLRKFDDYNDVTDENLAEILTNFIEKKFSLAAITERNLYLEKISIFIIHTSQIINKDNKNIEVCLVAKVYEKYLLDFIVKRNPVIPLNIFSSIYNNVWSGIWKLNTILIEKCFKDTLSTIKQCQILKLLTQLYNNTRFLLLDIEDSKQHLRKLEKALSKYVEDQQKQVSITSKVCAELISLIIEIKRFYSKTAIMDSSINWNKTGTNIQTITANFGKDISKKYKRFHNSLTLKTITSNNIPKLSNGINSTSEEQHGLVETDQKKSSKRKIKNIENLRDANGIVYDEDDNKTEDVITKTPKLKKKKGLSNGIAYDEDDNKTEDVITKTPKLKKKKGLSNGIAYDEDDNKKEEVITKAPMLKKKKELSNGIAYDEDDNKKEEVMTKAPKLKKKKELSTGNEDSIKRKSSSKHNSAKKLKTNKMNL